MSHIHFLGCGCDHDDLEQGFSFSLFMHINVETLTCLNESSTGAVKRIFKAHDDRLDTSNGVLKSDADEELIVHIPFTGSVVVKKIALIGPDPDGHPSKMKAYVNNENIDFDNIEEMTPIQEWNLVDDPSGNAEYPTRVAKFQGIHHLTLYFPSNFGGVDETQISYIGLSGTHKNLKCEPVICSYEVMGNPADNKMKEDWKNSSDMGF